MLTMQTLYAQSEKVNYLNKPVKFDLQGHRGARGLMPENTLGAFKKAIELGVNTLELDVVITKDKQIVVSHEPWMNAEICLNPNGNSIQKDKEKSFNIYQMSYEEVKTFDCGSKYNKAFPYQELASAHKPLLKDVLNMADSVSRNHGKKIKFNIELKSLPQGDDIFHPKPQEFVKLVMDCILHETDLERVNLQSFDFRILQELHQSYPDVVLAVLVYQTDMPTALDELGFIPEIYSPYFPLVNKNLIKEAHAQDMKVIPWTVNKPEQMKTLLNMGVDGLITDYPDRAIQFKKP